MRDRMLPRSPGLWEKFKKRNVKTSRFGLENQKSLRSRKGERKALLYLITPFSCLGSPFITLHFAAQLFQQGLITSPNYYLNITYPHSTHSFLDSSGRALCGQRVLLAT